MEIADKTSTCHLNPSISDEQFIPGHIFICLLAGSMTVYAGDHTYPLQPGDYRLARRNRLAKYIKQPVNGELKAVSVLFSQDFLKDFSHAYNYTADGAGVQDTRTVLALQPNELLAGCVQSMLPYLSVDKRTHEQLLQLKYKELLLLLLQANPALNQVLFDFSEPGKIDLEAFMNRNFRFNVSLERFAYLTGRSLTTFKRDFFCIFQQPPGKWLQEKRLQEAYFMLKQQNASPSAVYLEVGFQDLSHFSYAFKNKYGLSPNQLKTSPTKM